MLNNIIHILMYFQSLLNINPFIFKFKCIIAAYVNNKGFKFKISNQDIAVYTNPVGKSTKDKIEGLLSLHADIHNSCIAKFEP